VPIGFGGFELTPESYELKRAGMPLRVEPRVLEVLAYLVTHRDRVVAKELG
jgi:DNA-binding winged helix-turn-helix (wHTH) protein